MKSVLTAQIENILKTYPDTRNSDITLTLYVWMFGYSHLIGGMWDAQEAPSYRGATVELKHLFELPREDNVKRIRAKFNAQGLYWPTDLKIAKARGIQEDKWREFMGYPKVAATQVPTREESYTQQPGVALSSRPDSRQPELM